MKTVDRFRQCLFGPWISAGEDVQFKIVESDLEIAIYFQPTSSLSDWAHNFDFPSIPYRNMETKWRAHRGFVRLWKSVQDTVIAHTEGTKPLVISGYSEGAAIALLCYEDARYRTPDRRIFGVGFGTPRVVWGKAPESFSGFERWSVRKDIVTHVPFIVMGYRHVGKGYRIKNMLKERPPLWWTHHLPQQYESSLGGLS